MDSTEQPPEKPADPPKVLSEAAKRALAEAAERRAKADAAAGKLPPEQGGPTGPEPTRYGDWEKNGRCIDF